MKRLRARLLRWYRANRRDLPWRRTSDPYRVWVSEMMLQQTRVAAVLEHYRKFLEKFPDVHRLAGASESEVLAAWSGLGYYRRARAMHSAAKKMVESGGEFPKSSGALEELPGVGRYTAAAIASIAFGEPVAVVDGNVERVLSRVLGADLRDRKAAWLHAQELLDPKHPGDWNQAVMELGATICAPAEPNCAKCPLAEWCMDPGRPAGKPKGVRHRKQLLYGLCSKRGSVYLVQRPAELRLMAGMWELPGVEGGNGSPVLLRTRHSITNSDYEVLVVGLERANVSGGKWVRVQDFAALPLTGLARKILRATKLWPLA